MANNNQTLVQRSQDQIALWQLIEETGGEINEVMESWLAEVEQNLAVKVDSYKFFQDELAANADRLRAQAAEISAAARSIESVGDRLKSRIKEVMAMMGTDEVKGRTYRYKISKAAPKMVIDPTAIPASFMIVKTVHEPDKERIKSTLESGGVVPGAYLEEVRSIRAYVNKEAK